MRVIEQARLWFREGTSDKVYEVDLVEVATNQHVVNFRYGRRGSALRDGTKTATPVDLKKAKAIFDKLVAEKTAGGYRPLAASGGAASPAPRAAPAGNGAAPDDGGAAVIARLRLGHRGDTPIGRAIWRASDLDLHAAEPALLELLDASPPPGPRKLDAATWRHTVLSALVRCATTAALSRLEAIAPTTSRGGSSRATSTSRRSRPTRRGCPRRSRSCRPSCPSSRPRGTPGGAASTTRAQKYFNYLYQRDKELWFKLDPVITVHPDQVFFECFSQGRVELRAARRELRGVRGARRARVRHHEHRLQRALYGEFQKIRSYKTTTLDVDPSGFDVSTSMEEAYREVKIDVPDTLGPRVPPGQLRRDAAGPRRRAAPDGRPQPVPRPAPQQGAVRAALAAVPAHARDAGEDRRRAVEHRARVPAQRCHRRDAGRDPDVGPPPAAHPRAPAAAREAGPRVPARLRPAHVTGSSTSAICRSRSGCRGGRSTTGRTPATSI